MAARGPDEGTSLKSPLTVIAGSALSDPPLSSASSICRTAASSLISPLVCLAAVYSGWLSDRLTMAG